MTPGIASAPPNPIALWFVAIGMSDCRRFIIIGVRSVNGRWLISFKLEIETCFHSKFFNKRQIYQVLNKSVKEKQISNQFKHKIQYNTETNDQLMIIYMWKLLFNYCGYMHLQNCYLQQYFELFYHPKNEHKPDKMLNFYTNFENQRIRMLTKFVFWISNLE